MLRQFFFLISISLIQIEAHAQFKTNIATYLDETNIAQVFVADNQIDSAIKHYEIALHNFNEAKMTWFDLGDLYLKKQNYPKAIDAYSTAILNGAFASSNMHSEDFRKDFNDPHLLPFVQNLDSLFGVFYIRKCNWEFTLLIQELHGADQSIRNMEDILVGNDTTKLLEFNRLLALTDTAYNLPKLLDYFDNHPFPKASTLNGDVSTSFWVIVHHILQFDESNVNVVKLRKYIVDAVYNGDYDLKGYITTLDYQYIGKNMKQLYGIYKAKNKQGIYQYYPEIADIQGVDKRRAEWHLLPLYLEKKVNDRHPDAPTGYDPKTQQK